MRVTDMKGHDKLDGTYQEVWLRISRKNPNGWHIGTLSLQRLLQLANTTVHPSWHTFWVDHFDLKKDKQVTEFILVLKGIRSEDVQIKLTPKQERQILEDNERVRSALAAYDAEGEALEESEG